MACQVVSPWVQTNSLPILELCRSFCPSIPFACWDDVARSSPQLACDVLIERGGDKEALQRIVARHPSLAHHVYMHAAACGRVDVLCQLQGPSYVPDGTTIDNAAVWAIKHGHDVCAAHVVTMFFPRLVQPKGRFSGLLRGSFSGKLSQTVTALLSQVEGPQHATHVAGMYGVCTSPPIISYISAWKEGLSIFWRLFVERRWEPSLRWRFVTDLVRAGAARAVLHLLTNHPASFPQDGPHAVYIRDCLVQVATAPEEDGAG